MKIYTRTGDDGTTGLIGGSRVRKSDPRLDCYGTLDELNASLGLAQVVAPPAVASLLQVIQTELFVLGAHLATPEPGKHPSLPPLDDAMPARLEMEIDTAEQSLPSLRNFILPGGCECAARLHLSRTICRRAERLIVDFAMDIPALNESKKPALSSTPLRPQGSEPSESKGPIPIVILTYLNRLSDWLFVHARLANHLAGIPDIPWQPK